MFFVKAWSYFKLPKLRRMINLTTKEGKKLGVGEGSKLDVWPKVTGYFFLG